MKTNLTIALLIIISIIVYASVNKEPQKFKTTFSITYNAITLEQASTIEKKIKNEFGDACNVEIKVENTENLIIGNRIFVDTLQSSPYFYLNNNSHINPNH